jgi:hypothetical protein
MARRPAAGYRRDHSPEAQCGLDKVSRPYDTLPDTVTLSMEFGKCSPALFGPTGRESRAQGTRGRRPNALGRRRDDKPLRPERSQELLQKPWAGVSRPVGPVILILLIRFNSSASEIPAW